MFHKGIGDPHHCALPVIVAGLAGPVKVELPVRVAVCADAYILERVIVQFAAQGDPGLAGRFCISPVKDSGGISFYESIGKHCSA